MYQVGIAVDLAVLGSALLALAKDKKNLACFLLLTGMSGSFGVQVLANQLKNLSADQLQTLVRNIKP